ncbi:hypothetical protein CRG98_008376 [Punica granatum]|uniref:Reverse transcriptase Ty1/copia-type domain-containing protein n=1 Tax=Punica granatum TaxID=22663 RepID=A0A2I0KRV5_PUNGR|nr:hypothetical protein CRG98_008376 [Punica granatum]
MSGGGGEVFGSDMQYNSTFKSAVYSGLGRLHAGQTRDPRLVARLAGPFQNRPISSTHAARGPAPCSSHALGLAQYFGPRSAVFCQLCNHFGHIAPVCQLSQVFGAQAHLTHDSSSGLHDLDWYMDLGATHHVTSDLSNLNLRDDKIMSLVMTSFIESPVLMYLSKMGLLNDSVAYLEESCKIFLWAHMCCWSHSLLLRHANILLGEQQCRRSIQYYFKIIRGILFHNLLLRMSLAGLQEHLFQSIITALQKEFAMKDFGSLHYFLGMEAHRNSTGLHLTQSKYIHDILACTSMLDCKPVSSPITTRSRLLS